MKMRNDRTTHKWERHQAYCAEGDRIDRLLNRKRSICRVKTLIEKRIEKYGLSNYLAYCDEYAI